MTCLRSDEGKEFDVDTLRSACGRRARHGGMENTSWLDQLLCPS